MPVLVLHHLFLTLREALHFLLEVWIFFSVFVLSWTRPILWTMRLLGHEAAAEALAHRLMGRWCRWAMRVLRCRVEVEGREHLPARGPYVVMSNHQSNYDPILLVGFLDHSLGFIAKRELFRVPGLGYWLRSSWTLGTNGPTHSAPSSMVLWDRSSSSILSRRRHYHPASSAHQKPLAVG